MPSIDELELTMIGEVVVLTAESPDELELQAALAYAAVKWRRRQLLLELAEGEPRPPPRLVASRRRKVALARRRQ